MGLMFRVAVLRGCRRGELCGFRWADAELDKPYGDPAPGEGRNGAVLTVERPIVQLGGKLRESKAKTRAGKRRVFLDHDTATLQREHRRAQLKVHGRTTTWCSAKTTASPGTRTTCPNGSRSWPPWRVCRWSPCTRAGGTPATR